MTLLAYRRYRSHRGVGLACLCLLAAASALGQQPPPSPAPSARMVVTPEIAVLSTLKAGAYESKFLLGFGVKLGYAPPPATRHVTLAPYVSGRAIMVMTIMMGSSPSLGGYSAEAGAVLVAHVTGSLLGSIGAGLGRVFAHYEMPPSFSYGAVNAGLQLRTTPRATLNVGVEQWTSLGGPSVSDLHWVVGASWYLGH